MGNVVRYGRRPRHRGGRPQQGARRRKGSASAPWQPFVLIALAAVIYAVMEFSTQDSTQDTGPHGMAGPCRGSAERCVVDGDTLRFGSERIRLHGIDAPEMSQQCRIAGQSYACGHAARTALLDIVARGSVICRRQGHDRYGRTIATCYVDGRDVAEVLVRMGWALAYRRYSDAYVSAEQDARGGRRGVWRGEFERPWNWRRSN